MSGITLSKAVRTNLLNMQSTAAMLAKSQERLSSGLRVNSALDNPTNFFTAQSLNSRASDLSQLSDAVSNAVQTVAAADKGITAITKLVESAQATARQALQTSATGQTGPTASTIDIDALTIYAPGPAEAASVTGIAIPDEEVAAHTIFLSDAMTMTYDNGIESLTIELDAAFGAEVDPDNVGQSYVGLPVWWIFRDQTHVLNTYLPDSFGAGDFSISASSGHVVVTLGTDTTNTLTISGSGAEALGIAGTFAPRPLVEPGGETTGDVVINGQTITLEDGDDAAAIWSKFQSAAAASSGSFSVSNSSGVLTITGTDGSDLTISGDANTLAAVGLTATGAPNPKRAELVSTYNDLISQIDSLARDAGFNGVNLLNGDDLSVLFNEDGTSKLDIKGLTNTLAGLGLSTLSASDFDSNSSINAVLDELKGVLDTLRTQSSRLGANLSVVQTRQAHTSGMIDVLRNGAANLTLADSNEEAANVLALQTRQQLSSTALSLASQSDQNVLRLF